MLTALGVLVAWIALQWWVLPDSGCLRERCRTRAGRGHADPSASLITQRSDESQFQ